MKAKTLWDDEWTTITQTKVRTTVRRHYDDTDDEVTYISNETAARLIRDMIDADNDPNTPPITGGEASPGGNLGAGEVDYNTKIKKGE
jgi:hypothetical protein